LTQNRQKREICSFFLQAIELPIFEEYLKMEAMTKKSAVTMTKKKLIHLISEEQEIHPEDVRHVIQAFLDKMTTCLSAGNRLEFRDFGVFEIVERKQKNWSQSQGP